jgi:protein-tyrosine phosphatase
VIDLHSHLLPAVDDGSRSVEQSVKVLREMALRGITDVCLTPHLQARWAEAGPPPAHQRSFDALSAQAPPRPRLHRGAEVMLDRPITQAVAIARNVTLGGSRYILVEFPRLVAYDIATSALARVVQVGLVPVLAHPERYSCCSVEAVRLVEEMVRRDWEVHWFGPERPDWDEFAGSGPVESSRVQRRRCV